MFLYINKIEEETNLPLIPFDRESYKNPNLAPNADMDKELLRIKERFKPIRLKELKKFAKKVDMMRQRYQK